MKLYFIRHGETIYNQEDRFQGLCDSALTKEGQRQALAFADFFSKKEIRKIYSSPLPRSKITAEIIAQQVKVPIIIGENLREICYGEWEGKNKAELKDARLWEIRKTNRYSFVHPGVYDGNIGESYEQQYLVLAKFLEKLLKESKEENILIVSHLGIQRNALRFFKKCSDEEVADYSPKNNEVLIAEINSGETRTESRIINTF